MSDANRAIGRPSIDRRAARRHGGARRGDAGLVGRRLFLAGGLAAAATLALPPLPRSRASVPVRPRADWGGGLPPGNGLEEEHPDDVRFLLLHHSASGNDYEPDAVPGILGSFYRHHTETHGWPDVAYNFFVDRFGTVWEGRAGSLDGPVKGDATGGSQGFALLCCFVGDHTAEPPTESALDAMVGLCAGLALRYGIDPSPGARTTFVSRGSNKWPAGAEVETATVAGHRDMSRTACPGDAGYRVVTEELPDRIAAVRARLEGAVGAAAEGEGEESEPEPEPEPESEPEPSAPEPDPVPERRLAQEPGPPPETSPESGQQRGPGRRSAQPHDRGLRTAASRDTDEEGGLLEGLGLRELTVLGVAAAAAGGAAAVTRSRRTGSGHHSRAAEEPD